MTDTALVFEDSDKIGRVASVDTSRVLVVVDDHSLVTHVSPGHLVAIRGTTQQEYLIGIADRVVRTMEEALIEVSDGEEGALSSEPVERDALRAVLVGTYRTVQGEMRDVFKRGADTFPQVERECYVVRGANLQKLMGLASRAVEAHERLELGQYVIDPCARAVANGDKLFQRHAAILGSTGCGKSWTVALLLERASALKHPNIIVLDMHGEYWPLTTGAAPIAKGFRIAGPGDLSVPGEDVLFLPYWVLNREEMIALCVDRSDQNAPNQAARFVTHVRSLKEAALREAKKADVLETFTVDSPVPYGLDDVLQRLRAEDTERVAGERANTTRHGDWYGRLTRFISRLEAKHDDRRYGFMFQPSGPAMQYEWLAETMCKVFGVRDGERGITVIDFSEVPSDVLPVVVGTLARLIYDVQFWMQPEKTVPLACVCDEAHVYLPVRESVDSAERRAVEVFERIAKEGRKYGVGLVVVSQRPSDVSRTILSQCNNFLAMRLTNDEDQSAVKRLVPDGFAGLVDVLPLLDTGEAVVLGDAMLLPSRVKLDKPRTSPASSTREFWSEWASKAPEEAAIREAVETLRRQTRPE